MKLKLGCKNFWVMLKTQVGESRIEAKAILVLDLTDEARVGKVCAFMLSWSVLECM